MEPVEIKSRDGLTLVGYLASGWCGAKKSSVGYQSTWWTLVRDDWAFTSGVSMVANRGYAVLSVNFRGSMGYGKKFLNAGNGEWGRKMQNDITDAVRWAIDKGIADPKSVGIFGGSYGGYATLVGITSTPELYACAIDAVGPAMLEVCFNRFQNIGNR